MWVCTVDSPVETHYPIQHPGLARWRDSQLVDHVPKDGSDTVHVIFPAGSLCGVESVRRSFDTGCERTFALAQTQIQSPGFSVSTNPVPLPAPSLPDHTGLALLPHTIRYLGTISPSKTDNRF